MPEIIVNNQRTIEYSKEEIQQLIHEDLCRRGLAKVDDRVVSITDRQIKIGEAPIGNFDSDPIYGFGGIKITINS